MLNFGFGCSYPLMLKALQWELGGQIASNTQIQIVKAIVY